jgi:hypothetical protein
VTDLLTAAKDQSPWLFAFLLIVAALVYLVEKLGQRDGPITRLIGYFTNRELNNLRRRGELEAERQRQAAATEGRALARYRRRLGEAYDEIEELETTVDWLLKDRDDQRRRDRARVHFDSELVTWFQDVIATVRAVAPGAQLPDPPRPPQGLADLLVVGDDVPEGVRPRLRPATVRSRREQLEREWAEEDAQADLEPDPEAIDDGRRYPGRLSDRRR